MVVCNWTLCFWHPENLQKQLFYELYLYFLYTYYFVSLDAKSNYLCALHVFGKLIILLFLDIRIYRVVTLIKH